MRGEKVIIVSRQWPVLCMYYRSRPIPLELSAELFLVRTVTPVWGREKLMIKNELTRRKSKTARNHVAIIPRCC